MGWWGGIVRRLGHQRWFAVLGRAVVPVDRAIFRASGGRWTIIGRRVVPQLLLTTTGRRSGRDRTCPLLYATDGDGYVVAASNWGQAHHPAWSANLLARPAARISVAGREVPVLAELTRGTERDRLWALMAQVWPAYRTYADRAGAREIRVFRLTPQT